MDALSRFFVQQPPHILAVALVYALLWAAARFFGNSLIHHPNAILLPTLAWLAYAAWEWLVLVRTPEANIRVDLMIIWPLLVFLTIWAVVSMFRG